MEAELTPASPTKPFEESDTELEDEFDLEFESGDEEVTVYEPKIENLKIPDNVYEELKRNEDMDFSATSFKFQRGLNPSRQTLWHSGQATKELQESSHGCRRITSYFRVKTITPKA